jgi:hypothetical protein
MTIETISGASLEYYLIAFDENGKEREEGKTSQQILDILSQEQITDVFIFSHGWMGDVPAARKQYSQWIGAMAQNKPDTALIQSRCPGFRPLMIGLHWPSLQWGDENLESVSFDTADISPVEQLIEEQAQFIANTESGREALRIIFSSAIDNSAPDELPPEVRAAYEILVKESSLTSEGIDAAPGADWESFDAESIFETAEETPVNYANSSNFMGGKLLEPLRVLTFWKMKDRARRIGETAGFQLLTKLQLGSSDNVRFHLMGHSFGCIVVSATLAGENCRGTLVRPVNSVSLLQGALSLWSYCSNIPVTPGKSGYFYSIIADRKVNGSIITTQSEKDTAVGKMYPMAALLGHQINYGPSELPKYGAIGHYGIHGSGLEIVDMKMLPANGQYKFEANKIYNLESTQYICDMGNGFVNHFTTGAHNDIAKPEVANAVWQAVLAS